MRLLPQPAPEALTLPSVLHALGDPVRLELVRRASAMPDATCAVTADGLDVPISTLSNHWRILREAGLLSMTADGRYRRICLRTNDLQERFPGLLESVLRLGDAEAATP
nr:helix-turn-helix domain-containing protein [Kibdelosporangium sp. MJ126-NF4]CEL13830.1 Transcriptional regulator, ArsR family [Kibdelosporangium sp. MJ126-NF4]CTQ88198.1 Transcriptional regulator, ArsR family [Kibdelosporangium sp. MJ126-NF4]